MNTQLKVYAALHEHIAEGFVWLKQSGLPARCVVKITNIENGRSIHCEALQIDSNFLPRYNDSHQRNKVDHPDSSIVIGHWYRAHLGGLNTKTTYALKIEKANNCWGKLRASLGHPQMVVRFATTLGISGLILGIIGVVLGVISIWPTK